MTLIFVFTSGIAVVFIAHWKKKKCEKGDNNLDLAHECIIKHCCMQLVCNSICFFLSMNRTIKEENARSNGCQYFV